MVQEGTKKNTYNLGYIYYEGNCHCVQTSCWAHPASYPMDTGAFLWE